MKNTQHYLVSLVVFVVVILTGVYKYRNYQILRDKKAQQHLASITHAQALLIENPIDPMHFIDQIRAVRADKS